MNSWIPGCVLEAIVEIATGKPDMTQTEFSRADKKLNFFAHLASRTSPEKTKRDYSFTTRKPPIAYLPAQVKVARSIRSPFHRMAVG